MHRYESTAISNKDMIESDLPPAIKHTTIIALAHYLNQKQYFISPGHEHSVVSHLVDD